VALREITSITQSREAAEDNGAPVPRRVVFMATVPDTTEESILDIFKGIGFLDA